MADIEKALDFAHRHGQNDGSHHRLWVIDQMVRALLGDRYDEWVREYTKGGEYDWDVGIPP